MKYCTQCGQELVDDAKICSSCGSEQKEPDKKGKKSLPISNSFLPLNIANFLFWILIITACVFMMIAIIFPYINVYTNYNYNYDYNYNYTSSYYYISNVYVDAYFFPAYTWSLVAFIISATALLFSFIPVIISIVGVIMKKIKSNYVFGALTQFVLSAGLFTVTLLMMINGW